jgi:phosphate transport system permease protein
VAATTMPPSGRASLTRSSISRGRRARNTIATLLVYAALAFALIPLGFVLYYVTSKGIGVIDGGFLTEELPSQVRRATGGIGPAIAGTLVITGFATLLAVPLGILAAVYLHEYGGSNPLASVLRFLSNVMAGVPSIVMGLFIFTIYVLRSESGLSALAGALALACLMLPIVIRATEGMLGLVPNELREAAYALGTSKSRTIITVVLPAALPGITSGALLAVARAAGETAPLLFTIGASRQYNWSLSGPNTALSAQIFSNAQTGFPAAIDRAWGAALTLIVLVLLLSTLARIIAARFTVR